MVEHPRLVLSPSDAYVCKGQRGLIYAPCRCIRRPFHRRSSSWAESDECAGFVPALWAGGPEPFYVTVGASGVGHAAEASHGCTPADVAVSLMDGVALSGEGEPRKRTRTHVRGDHD